MPISSSHIPRSASGLEVDTRDPSPVLDHDVMLHALQGRATSGLSPYGLGLAFLDWSLHLANAPFRRAELARSAGAHWLNSCARQPERV